MTSVGAGGSNNWQPEVDEIAARKERALAMGGDVALEKQRSRGKWTVRERITGLFEEDSFEEIGTLSGFADDESTELGSSFVPSNVLIGVGRVSGRDVAVCGDDFTVGNGTPNEVGSAKRAFIETLAVEMRMPVVRLVDMAGASLKGMEDRGYTSMPAATQWQWLSVLSEVPVVSIACGPCPGLGAWRVAASHFSVQIEGIGQVFAAGPPVVAAGMRQRVTAEELGGAQIHAKHSGVVDNSAVDEADALAQAARFLSYLPQSVHELPQRTEPTDDPERRDDFLLGIIPRNVRSIYDSRKIIRAVFDHDSVFEVGRGWGRSSIVGFARLDGYPVGFISNDPKFYGGGMDDQAAEKLTRHIDLCDTFNIPMVNLADQPGTVIGVDAEMRGTIRRGLRALAAIEQCTIPWYTVVTRRLFGVGGAAYGPTRRLNNRIAWPSARWGPMPVEGGVDALYRRDIEASPDPDARRSELEAKFSALGSPLRTAARFGVNDVIDPRDTRAILCRWIGPAYRTMDPVAKRRSLRP
ncbi:acyl-CoA carboxylase subunit beta [Homoserinimonas sp. A447]